MVLNTDNKKGKVIMKLSTSSLLLACLLALAGCATPQSRAPKADSLSASLEADKQRQMVVEDFFESNQKLQSVASKVIITGAELCGDSVAPHFGITTWSADNFQGDWKKAVQDRYGLTEQLHISSVTEGSPAHTAGLLNGDAIKSVNGLALPMGKDAAKRQNEQLREAGKTGLPVDFTIERNGETRSVMVVPVQACDFTVRLQQDDVKNAYADGKNIVIYKGMMDFFKSDEELALVLSHELAHNSMKHIDAKKRNATLGGIIGLLVDVAAAAGGVNTNGDFTRLAMNAGSGAYSVEFEQEADYVGLYFMAIAGYKIDDAPNFWRRMATSNSSSISMKSSHPTAPERFVALENTVQEINDKIAGDLPLKPEMK
jgi:Zn-dependent protease with chaperone function